MRVRYRESFFLLMPQPKVQDILILFLIFQWISLSKWKCGSPGTWLSRYIVWKNYEYVRRTAWNCHRDPRS